MTSKEALHDLFTEANRSNGEKIKFITDELLERFNTIAKDLEILDFLNGVIKEAVKEWLENE